MTRAELARLLDHSVLKPEATLADIVAGVDVVRDVARSASTACSRAGCAWPRTRSPAPMRSSSVVGFPHGCDRAEVKARAAALAVADGAREIDMVMNFGALRSGDARARRRRHRSRRARRAGRARSR